MKSILSPNLNAPKQRPIFPLLWQKIAAFIIGSTPVVWSLCPEHLAYGADSARKPNILLILADDLGWSDLGCYGGEIPTPNLDALAQSGLRFTQFYNNAVCGPSRASLLTGLYPQQIGHSGRHWNEATDFSHCIGLGEVLQSAGYRTLMVGKWQERMLPAERGFDRFFGPLCAGKISYFHEVQANPFYLDTSRWEFPKEGFYLTEALTDHAVEFVEEALALARGSATPQPFFLYLAHLAPHWPLHAREVDIAPHRERYREAGWDFWRGHRVGRQRELGLIPPEWQLAPWPAGISPWQRDALTEWQAERMAVYAAQVTSIDRSVGRMLDAIRRADAIENTLVIFLSDNGAAPDGGLAPTKSGFVQPDEAWRLDGQRIRPGSSPQWMPGGPETFAAYGLAWATTSNTPFRSHKQTAYEGGIRTPLIVHWPAVLGQRGQLREAVGHLMDLLPTLAAVAETTQPGMANGRKLLPWEGRNLLPVWRGESNQGHSELVWRAPKNRAIRAGNWKLVESPADQTWELYDLEHDGTEATNLASKHPDLVQELAAQWQKWADRVGAKP